ncbi:MAG: rod shape-determining protein MreD [Veillonellaceae bacterium]|jgi:rod shape-determining protein MreD|nr:rod shape-determining protein MreD [Veillonellaceae bacterium]
MKVFFWTLVIVMMLVIQSTIVPLLAIQGITPDLLLIVVVSASLLFGKDHGVGTGFFSGLLQDLASGNIFGVNTLSKLSTGYLFGMAERQVFKEHILLPILAVAVATLFSGLIALLMMLILGYKIQLFAALINRVLPAVLYNMVFSIPIHKGIYSLSKKFNKA